MINLLQYGSLILVELCQQLTGHWRPLQNQKEHPGDRVKTHQQNVNWSGSHTDTSQTLQFTLSVLLSTSSCPQTPLDVSNVPSDSAWAFSCAPENTYSYGGAFKMLQHLTYRIAKVWGSKDCWAGLQETLRAAETSAQLCGRLGATFWLQWFWGFNNHKAFCLLYSSLLQSQDSLGNHMAFIISKHLEMTIERTWRCTWRPLSQENPLLTTTAIQIGRGKMAGDMRKHWHKRYRLRIGEGGEADGDTGTPQMDYAMGSIHVKGYPLAAIMVLVSMNRNDYLSHSDMHNT